ncbi:MAG: hypothetical protein P4L41_09170 [Flavipsychrobacter sp.]|nr:hypothetical protein [Flavipsychrobacter sp.]
MPVNLRTGDPTICFERDILPIFQSNCAKGGCHDASSGRSGYVLDNYKDVIKKGIVPGNPAASKIWQSISMKIFNVEVMPQDGPSLSATDLDLIKRWIATGAIDSGACSTNNCDTTSFTYSGTIAPLMQKYCIGCHNSPSVAGGSLADYTSVKDAAVNGRLLGDIEHLPGYNAMPLGGNMLEDCQITQVKKWVAAGAPNN